MFVGEQLGKAGEAIELYTSLFRDSKVIHIERDAEGMVQQARFTLAGQEFRALDSGAEHRFTFTPAMSIFVQCENEAEIDALFQKLSDGGMVLMELEKYPFSEKFGWLNDRFGVSWQLNL
jgi:predicted 3-demethylubiquinone-9 3-methyltransferase (glyoxalase superfamily)